MSDVKKFLGIENDGLEKRYQKLFQDGKLVQVHVSKWGMCYQLEQKDLGLDEGKQLPEFFRLGKKMLFDDVIRNEFARIETRARTYLKDNSFKFPIADAHFIPQRKIAHVLEHLDKLKIEFDTLVGKFMENYEANKQAMLVKYPEHKATLEPYYPAVHDIKDKFGFSVAVFEIAFPKKFKEVTLTELQAQNEAVNEAKEKYRTQMDQQYKRAVEGMDSFIKEAVIALRGQVVEVFETIVRKIQNHELISKKNVNSIKTIIEEFDSLDFFDDKVVKAKLQLVKQAVAGNVDYKDNEAAVARLNTALGEVLTVTKNLSDVDALSGTYFRNIAINEL